MKIHMTLTVVSALAAACGGAGLGMEVRTDIQARMTSVKPALDTCYHQALKNNRRLRGMVTIELVAEASSGQFKHVMIRRDEVQSPEVRDCIVAEIGKLKLEKPTSANVQFTYPLRFSPTN